MDGKKNGCLSLTDKLRIEYRSVGEQVPGGEPPCGIQEGGNPKPGRPQIKVRRQQGGSLAPFSRCLYGI